MESFGLLMGHLVGDYIVQNDWMAKNKVNPHPGGDRPCTSHFLEGGGWTTPGTPQDRDKWDAKWKEWMKGNLACTIHCFFYTLSVLLFSFWWMPWQGYLAVFLIHWPVDRFKLPLWWMKNVGGQREFATGPLSPWSVVVVDNTFHLLTLFCIQVLTGI